VTDRDIRTRVVAAGAGPETPLSDVMTAPAWTVSADRMATEALLEMLDHGITCRCSQREGGCSACWTTWT
jgi:CBS domain-containing protein